MAQDRSKDLGVWMPGHHLEAAKFVETCSTQSIPIVTFMDTPERMLNKKQTNKTKRTVSLG